MTVGIKTLWLVTYLLHNLHKQKNFYVTVFYSVFKNFPTFSGEKKKLKETPTILPLQNPTWKTPKPKSYQMCTEKLKTHYQNSSYNKSISPTKTLLYA